MTREIEDLRGKGLASWKGILEPFRKSALTDEERGWFQQNLNKTFWWAFNPELFWLFRYNYEEIIKNQIGVIPWFERNLSKVRKLLRREKVTEDVEEKMTRISRKLIESYGGWIKVILGIFGEYWLYKSRHPKKKSVKPPRWGIITYAPSQLKNALRKYSLPAKLVR